MVRVRVKVKVRMMSLSGRVGDQNQCIGPTVHVHDLQGQAQA